MRQANPKEDHVMRTFIRRFGFVGLLSLTVFI